MRTILRDLGFHTIAAVLSAALTIPAFGTNQSDTAIQAGVNRLLASKKDLHNVMVQVDDSIATLSGSASPSCKTSQAEI